MIKFYFAFAGFQFDYVFDWTILKYQQSQTAAPPSRPLVSSNVYMVEIYDMHFASKI